MFLNMPVFLCSSIQCHSWCTERGKTILPFSEIRDPVQWNSDNAVSRNLPKACWWDPAYWHAQQLKPYTQPWDRQWTHSMFAHLRNSEHFLKHSATFELQFVFSLPNARWYNNKVIWDLIIFEILKNVFGLMMMSNSSTVCLLCFICEWFARQIAYCFEK